MTATLRDSSETAARERLRLEAAVGRSRAQTLARRVPTKLGHLGSEEAARSGLRYQPVAWTAIVVAAVAFFFPGRPDSDDAAPVAIAPRTFVAASPGPGTQATPSPPTTVAPPAAVVTPSPPPPTASPDAPPPRSATTPTTAPPPPPTPLSVRGFGWASSLSGTGLGSADVPDGTMPVAARLGQLDKASFIRLAGTATTLTLSEDPEGAREAVGAAGVVACPITDPGWAEEPDQSLDEAPAWDAEACVAGVETDDTWVFDLAGFRDRAGDLGFALVPDAGAPPDFQVTFRSSS